MTDAHHVRNAVARFDQVIGVSDEDREQAFLSIGKAGGHYGVRLTETDWHQMGRTPHTGRTAEDRRMSARKGVGTRQRHEREREAELEEIGQDRERGEE